MNNEKIDFLADKYNKILEIQDNLKEAKISTKEVFNLVEKDKYYNPFHEDFRSELIKIRDDLISFIIREFEKVYPK